MTQTSERDTEKFTPKKLTGEEYNYHHSEDCEIGGCPSHTAKIKYHSVSHIIEVDLGDGAHFYLDGAQADIIWDWFNRAKI